MKKQSVLIIVFGLCVSVIVASCNRSCSKPKSDAIHVAVAFPIEALDSRYATSATASRVSDLVYGSLFEMSDNAEPKPFLAQSIETKNDTTYIVHLRKNLLFHDGSKLTAHDVVYTFGELKSPDVASPFADRLNYIKAIVALDDHTVMFTLHKPYAPMLVDLCAIGIVSKKACLGRSKLCRHEYVGSGPFKVAVFDSAKDSVSLVPFKDWFEGAPKAALNFRVVRDENTRILELMAQKTDLVDGDISPSSVATLKKQPQLTIKEIPGLGYTYLAINVRGPKPDEDKNTELYRTRLALANKDVRKAIAMAIDFEQIKDKLYFGMVERSSGLIPRNHWAKDKSLTPPPFDPAGAMKLLDKAGFTQTSGHKRFKLTIATTPNRLRQSTTQVYADFLEQVGIEANVRVKDWNALYQDMKNGQFELFSAIWVPVVDPDLYHFVHHSLSIPTEDKMGGNRHGYKNADVDRLIDLGRSTMDPEKRKPIYQEIERKLMEDLPYIPLWNENRIVIFNHERISGFEPSSTGSFLGLRKARLIIQP